MPEAATKEDAQHWNPHATDGGAAEMERAAKDRRRVANLLDPPDYSPENEQALIGSIILDNAQLDNPEVSGVLDSDFVGDTERTLFRWFCEMRDAGEPIEPVTLMPRIQSCAKRGDGSPLVTTANVSRAMGMAGVALHAPYYAGHVRAAGKRRRNWAIGLALVEDSHNGKIPDEAASDAIERLGAEAPKSTLPIMAVSIMADTFTELRPPIIHGILREGETLNVIAPPKTGKSWLTNDLAISIATGRPWLGKDTVQGDVLIVDNELHQETSAFRLPAVGNARMVRMEEYGEKITVCNLRGHLMDIHRLGIELFDRIKPGQYKLIIIDALYRVLPAGVSENDNSQMASVYNAIDSHALRLHCGFALIHHSSKGSQSNKSVVDVGAGAGSQSRASDTHLVLRQHKEGGAVVVEAAVRSWKPLEPFCLRWKFPVFDLADDLDPADLKPERPRREKPKAEADDTPPLPPWTRERFATEIVGTAYKSKDEIMADALDAGVPTKTAVVDLLSMTEAKGEIFRHCEPGGKPLFSTSKDKPPVAQCAQGEGGVGAPPRTPRVKQRTAAPRGRGGSRTRPRRKRAAR